MKIGIVGLPNAGKSTLFNALCRATVETAAYPFTTVDPNQAVVPVPDPLLAHLAEVVHASDTVYDTITFVDIAGLVRGAHAGEGLGNEFLAQIRETDAIVHTIRAFADGQVAHPHGEVDACADLETVNTELLLADLEQAQRRHERATRKAKSGLPEDIAIADQLAALATDLAAGKPVATVPVARELAGAEELAGFITAKPVLYVVNADDDKATLGLDEVDAVLATRLRAEAAPAIVLSARLEADLAALAADEAAAMRADLDLGPSVLERTVAGAFDLLELIVFYTAHAGSEATARSLRRGGTAHDAAGKVHSDMQRGFVRAEVVPASTLIETGSYAAVREAGLLRVEGRDYVVQDRDVITIRFAQ